MGLLEQAQVKKKKDQEPEIIEERMPESSSGLLEKAHQKQTVKPSAPKKKQKKPEPKVNNKEAEGLLAQAHQKQEKDAPVIKSTKDQQEVKKFYPESKSPEKRTQGTGLLAKAKRQVSVEETAAFAIKPGETGVDIIEEQEGFGWKQMGSQRVVFDRSNCQYRYEVHEPALNKREEKIKENLAHLFKMLADIDTFNFNDEEKAQFLEETLEKIITDNKIKFTETVKSKSKLFMMEKHTKKKTNSQKNTFSLLKKKTDETNKEEENPEEWKLTPQSRDKIFYHMFRDFLGYGRLDIVMHDDGIEDISCDGPETPIFLHHRKYEAIMTNIYFDSPEELNSFLVRMCQISGKQISIYSPIVDGKLPDGSRLQATLARTVTVGSTFTIRKFKEDPLTPIDLLKYNSLSLEMAAYFWMAIENNASILFCGGTASGKTSALNALSLFVPYTYKIISIEDTREVNLPHKNWIAGTTRKGFSASDQDKTGKDIDMFDLIRAALRQRPRVIIVGEVRGKEAYSLFQAMATGHTSYATVHASDIHTLIQRLENPPIELPRALLTSLDVIVFQNAVYINKKMVRRMTSVTEIIKLDSDTNQLIFMAPYTWISKTDDRFESSRNSKVMSKIRQQNEWTEEQLEEELSNRMIVLQWMLQKNIRSYKEVGKVIADYAVFPDQILEKAREELNQ